MSGKIYVCGLGPGGIGQVTSQTKDFLAKSDLKKYLRTNKHPSASIVGRSDSYDHFYESKDSFEEVYSSIFENLINLAASQDLVYITPGSPLVLEDTVQLLLDQQDVEVELFPAISFLDVTWAKLKLDPVNSGVQLVDGQQFKQQSSGNNGPLLVAQTYSKKILSDIKLSIDDYEPFTVTVLQSLGTPDEKIFDIDFYDMDKEITPDHLTSIFIPKLPNAIGSNLAANVDLIHTLRQRCPWDQQQTHSSLIKYLEEETLEVIEAIQNLDFELGTGFEELEDELGDLWLQILLHSEIASESGQFNINDVARALKTKMIRRHPHVFGNSTASSMEELEQQWIEIKEKES